MPDNDTKAIPSALGRRAGEWIAKRWGGGITDAFESGKAFTGPLGRALVDAFIVERLTGAFWPPLVMLVSVFAIHLAASIVDTPEAERVLLGAAIASVFVWSGYEIALAAHAVWPHLRFWAGTRLSPVHHARLMLFHEVRAAYHGWEETLFDSSFTADVLRATLAAVQARLKLTADHAAFAIADHLAPILVRHLAARLGLIITPFVIGFLYYRFAIYPDIVQRNVGVGPWSVALYPFAALVDIVAGTELRLALLTR
jgi:hypothetical protein